MQNPCNNYTPQESADSTQPDGSNTCRRKAPRKNADEKCRRKVQTKTTSKLKAKFSAWGDGFFGGFSDGKIRCFRRRHSEDFGAKSTGKKLSARVLRFIRSVWKAAVAHPSLPCMACLLQMARYYMAGSCRAIRDEWQHVGTWIEKMWSHSVRALGDLTPLICGIASCSSQSCRCWGFCCESCNCCALCSITPQSFHDMPTYHS